MGTKEVPLTIAALKDLLTLGGLPDTLAVTASFTGAGDIYPTPFRLGAATAAAIAATQIAAQMLEKRSDPFTVNLGISAATTSSFRYIRLNGDPIKGPRDPLTGFYLCSDGRWIFLHLNFPHHRARALDVLGIVEPDRKVIEHAVSGWGSAQLEDRLNQAGACATVALDREQWRASEAFSKLSTHSLLTIDKIDNSPPVERSVIRNLRVIDFTRVLAGPTCGRVLAELGASVLRVNNPHFADLPAYELDANRLKEQVTLDLQTPQDVQRLQSAVDNADIFLQAYRPKAIDRYGLSAADLTARRPGLIYVSLSAYGALNERRGFDSVLQSAAGLAMQQGGGVPNLLPTSPIDYLSGFLLAYGTLLALFRRAHEGGSYVVRTSLAQVADWLATLSPNSRTTSHLPSDELIASFMQQTKAGAGLLEHLRSPVTCF
jgi:crotonobetainyl-CoA:carnitine CoA-transferase CaiB-like acyl-CoA transferase